VVIWGHYKFDLEMFKPYMGSVKEIEKEDMDYVYGQVARLKCNLVILGSKSLYEKLANSYALAQSVKLFEYEEEIERSIINT
jgi:uncharacterized Rmd1/YagE family protein